MRLKTLGLILASLFIVSCSASGIYEEMRTGRVIKGITVNHTIDIPKGWFYAIDNECNCLEWWLIKDDYSAAINITRLNIDDFGAKPKYNSLIDASISFKQVKYKEKFKLHKVNEVYTLNNIDVFTYQFTDGDSNIISVALFEYKGNYFEITGLPAQKSNRYTASAKDINEAINAVIFSLK